MNLKKIARRSFPALISIFAIFISVSTLGSESAQQCASCHQKQVSDWEQSHHFRSMGHANEANVLGNFDDQKLQYLDGFAHFFREKNEFMISIPNKGSQLTTYQVLYTFGYEPLQQYMFDVGKGKIQLFPFAWDSRKKEDGGQRWFVLHPEQQQTDLFHYTQMGQNWNHMCADCHSTDFKKSFDLNTKTYNSTFTAINVSCNSCHGESKNHLVWAKNKRTDESQDLNKGFSDSIGKKTPLFQLQNNGSMKSVQPLKHSKQVSVCATCHSRRSSYQDRTKPSEFLGQYKPALITPDLYHVDGQVWDENYVWGSFTQSKMFARGVTCSNCHNPHSGKLNLPGNKTCTQCHSADNFNTPLHHGHELDNTGSQCVDCHMPATTYMQVDARRDHSFRVPRPDLTTKTGAPNSCNGCHVDKNPQWAHAAIKKWHPNSTRTDVPHFSQAFHAADKNLPNASDELIKIAKNNKVPNIIRASAIARLEQASDKSAIISIIKTLLDEDEPLKLQAVISASQSYPVLERWQMFNSLLNSRHLVVRLDVALSLAPMLIQSFPNNLSEADNIRLSNALEEYKKVQYYQADRGFSHTNLGNLALTLGEETNAEKHYLTAIEIEPTFISAYINLADLYRQQGQEDKVKNVIKQGLMINNKAGDLYYVIAMSLIRENKKNAALEFLEKATKYAQNNANYHYAFGLLLKDRGELGEAIHAFEKAFNISPGNPDISYNLSQILMARKNYSQAIFYAKNLKNLLPNNKEVDQYIQQIMIMESLNK